MMWVSPTEEELFKVCATTAIVLGLHVPFAHLCLQKYNPDLQRKSLANRQKTQEEWASYVALLKDYSKSDKNSAAIYFL